MSLIGWLSLLVTAVFSYFRARGLAVVFYGELFRIFWELCHSKTAYSLPKKGAKTSIFPDHSIFLFIYLNSWSVCTRIGMAIPTRHGKLTNLSFWGKTCHVATHDGAWWRADTWIRFFETPFFYSWPFHLFIYFLIYFNRSHFWQDCSVHASLWCVSNWEAIHFHLTAIFTSWILVDYMYLVSQLPPNHVNSKRRFCVDCVYPYAENERAFFYFASPLTACNPEFSAYLTFKLMTTVLLFFYFIFLTFCQTFISKRF